MAEDDGGGTGLDQAAEDVARVDLDAREAPAGDQRVQDDAMTHVQSERPELLDWDA
jgi:hypothetical protein